ncbi:variant erythrocyte surface antigen-1 family protein [Babesia caballi]|uniref:Variant erythrocyte surface antigen-1 family protein n=1 Tax=Babesia caballi TaxID=5871 RepID=A0AAV4M1R9_BABCB|nr:variant erythrocyte surface antigen-1 family protein [Babesia caballi]
MPAPVWKKSLTEPPENLKEAIDWVIQINAHAQDLAAALDALLKNDGSEVAMKVLDKYRLVSESVIEKLTPQTSERHFAVPHAILNKLSEGLRPFNERSDARINRKTLEQWVAEVREANLEKLIEGLARGLMKFIGYKENSGRADGQNGIGSQNYESSYKSVTDKWDSLSPDQHRDSAFILLGIMPVLYFGLSYLYWWCSPDSDGHPRWSKLKINDSGGQTQLKTLLTKVGFTHTSKLNGDKTGQNIVLFLNTGFNELFQGKASSQDYPKFLEKLQETAHWSPSLNTSHPLTSLYLISYYYITNFLYIVEPTSPATPSLAGYSGTAALAGGAYGFNIGGLGTFVSALLA